MVLKSGFIIGKKCKQEEKLKTWHKYADILIPFITIPLLVFIALLLNNYMTKSTEQDKWKILALSISLIVTSFVVFCYVCKRLNPLLGGRKSRIHLPIIRTNRTNTEFMRSVNSDLQFIIPFNNYPPTYESIIFDVPPSYTIVTTSSTSRDNPSTSNGIQHV